MIGVVGDSNKHRSELEALQAAPGVEEIVKISHPVQAGRAKLPPGRLGDRSSATASPSAARK